MMELSLVMPYNMVQERNQHRSGSSMEEVFVAETASRDVVAKPAVNVVYGPFQQKLLELLLKSGQVEVVVQVTPAVTAARSLSVEQAETTLLGRSIPHRDVNILSAPVDLGPAIIHILALQAWAVVHM